MNWTAADIPDLRGKVAVVTGANAGLGYEITRGLTHAGARVIMACRNRDKANAAANEIRSGSPAGTLEFGELDLADLASVTRFAEDLGSRTDRLDILGNNAGLMALDQSRTVDGFEMQFGVNHLGHFALTGRVLPLLLATPGSRVVAMSSVGHRPGRIHRHDPNFDKRRYSRWGAYFQSKLANLLFTLELQRRLQRLGSTTIAVAAHPGASHTDLGIEGSGIVNHLVGPLGRLYTQSAAKGALPFLYAATDPAIIGGSYCGPRLSLWGRPVLETPSRRSRDAAEAAELWNLSEELTEVAYLD
jgi:protochlorophyllide reductase